MSSTSSTPPGTGAPGASRVDVVYEWLLDAITALRLPAGSPLLENALARDLGVSRTPVREALQRLEREGLVQRSSSNRFVVALLSERDVREACDAMVVLDTYLFERAAARLTPEQDLVLSERVTRMRAAAEEGDAAGWAAADREFHATLAAAADNALVADLVRQVRRRVQRFWLTQAIRSERLASCSAEHTALAAAIRGGDAGGIRPLVEAHVSHMRDSLLHLLDQAAPLLGVAGWSTLHDAVHVDDVAHPDGQDA